MKTFYVGKNKLRIFVIFDSLKEYISGRKTTSICHKKSYACIDSQNTRIF